MSSDSYQSGEGKNVEVIYETVTVVSSEEPPRDEWSSLERVSEEHNPKKLLYEQGLYSPGSGDICTKYIAQSASSVLRHSYYRYPAIPDPGILHALLRPEDPIIYPDDGQDLYLALCKEMRLCPVRLFYKGLLEDTINLRYYGVNPKGVRAMAMALKYNKYVTLFNLTDNFLTLDASYHLGEMLASNGTLVELNLTGCHIGPSGAKMLLTNMLSNRTLRALNLSHNKLGDAGMAHLADAIYRGLDIRMINLSHNSISGLGMEPFIEAFQAHNKITHWNLSWNNLYDSATANFFTSLAETTKNLKKMDLSWNGMCGVPLAKGIKTLFTIPALKHLNLSYNKIEGDTIKTIMQSLTKAKNLVSLNLSYNPMAPKDVMFVFKKLKLKTAKVERVYMENISIDVEGLKMLTEIKQDKPDLIVTYSGVVGDFVPVGPDFRDVVLTRADYICAKSAKKLDFGVHILKLRKEYLPAFCMLGTEFYASFKRQGVPMEADLSEALINMFPAPPDDKGGKTINLLRLVEYVKRLWPNKKLPPTPPPKPPPPPPEPAPAPAAPPPPPPKGKK